MKLIDLTGHRFGRVEIVSRAPSAKGATRWNCRCECGNTFVAHRTNLISGDTSSCGCLQKEMVRARITVHGARSRIGKQSTEYVAWGNMKSRCFSSGRPGYRYYGGRGISVYPEWVKSFAAFLAYMGERPSHCSSIGRIDVNRGYEPGNVRWETDAQQARERRDNIWVEWNGQRMVLTDAVAAAGVPYTNVHKDFRYRGLDPVTSIIRRQKRLGISA